MILIFLILILIFTLGIAFSLVRFKKCGISCVDYNRGKILIGDNLIMKIDFFFFFFEKPPQEGEGEEKYIKPIQKNIQKGCLEGHPPSKH